MTVAVDVIDIPIIIRGRIIEPGDDAIVFGGRGGGAKFRQADARKYVRDLVLPNGSGLRDLYDMPMEEIIAFLAKIGPRVTLDNPLMRKAFDLALGSGEMTESVLRPIYEAFPYMFGADQLRAMIDAHVGIDYLDGWVEQGEPGKSAVRIRAVGTRQLHIIAGNVPVTAGITITRGALTKGDTLIKTPSNDPFTAAAIVQTMIGIDPDHPVTKHFSVAYWKGGDEEIEKQIIQPSKLERVTAWGGMSSMKHIQKYLVPGIELIPANPKFSISIVGHEALEDEAAMQHAALGVARLAGHMNQTACASTRIVYVECEEDDDDLALLEQFGQAIHAAFLNLPPHESTAPKFPNPDLESEMKALKVDREFYAVIGDASSAGVIVSRTAEEPVEFYGSLSNRVVNLVPVPDITRVPRWVNEETQTVGIFPESLRERLRDALALNGVQRSMAIDRSTQMNDIDPHELRRMPHDGIEPLRRSVRWAVDVETKQPRQ